MRSQQERRRRRRKRKRKKKKQRKEIQWGSWYRIVPVYMGDVKRVDTTEMYGIWKDWLLMATFDHAHFGPELDNIMVVSLSLRLISSLAARHWNGTERMWCSWEIVLLFKLMGKLWAACLFISVCWAIGIGGTARVIQDSTMPTLASLKANMFWIEYQSWRDFWSDYFIMAIIDPTLLVLMRCRWGGCWPCSPRDCPESSM